MSNKNLIILEDFVHIGLDESGVPRFLANNLTIKSVVESMIERREEPSRTAKRYGLSLDAISEAYEEYLNGCLPL